MKISNVLPGLAIIASAEAQLTAAASSSSESICDYYTNALLGSNTGANQKTLLTLVVNTAVIGNYTKPNVGVSVAGILAPGYFNGQKVELLPYFDGALASSNRGGSCGVSVNFLDGGGATPLEHNKPANNPHSNQFGLLTHLYQFFAALLGCSIYGTQGHHPYAGFNGMYEVHKFMALDAAEIGWFIEQVGLSAASFGVSKTDVDAVAAALYGAFGYRCSSPASIPAFEPAELQAICTQCDCPVSPHPDCSAYGNIINPLPASQANGNNCGNGYQCQGNGGGWNWGNQGWPWNN